jgi:uncharacterized glyoxalase superfamily protein PhnB
MTNRIGPVLAGRVFVRDLAAARRFYGETLGLKETLANAMIARFDTGGLTLVVEQVAADDPEGDELVGRYSGLVFHAPDAIAAQKAFEDTAAVGVNWLEPPSPTFWGGVMGHFADPEGNSHTLLYTPT